mmetsp:Transcript_4402/g.12107  ORF Transcript_4402/g.12107 Transcript_4402/m.12107 type:complete len:210 (+) Transcript_4402:415-1044(+)
MRAVAADSTMPFSPSVRACESLGWTFCNHCRTTSRVLRTSASGFLLVLRLLLSLRRHFTTRELCTASLSSVPSSKRRLYATLRLMPFKSITQDKFRVRRRCAPFSTRFVHEEYCKFRSCSFSSPLSIVVGNGFRHSLEAQNSSSNSTSGTQRSVQPSWPKYIRMVPTKASATGIASDSSKCLTRCFNVLQSERNSSPLQCTSRCAREAT